MNNGDLGQRSHFEGFHGQNSNGADTWEVRKLFIVEVDSKVYSYEADQQKWRCGVFRPAVHVLKLSANQRADFEEKRK